MIVFPNCKINIGLFITGKRADGFHSLESVFAPVDWKDVLEVNYSRHDSSLKVTGHQVTEEVEDNIVFKAFRLVQLKYGIENVSMHLLKHLPSGAGLGGGSSDASFTLKALNQLFNLDLTTTELQALAAELGSDCPFFIENKTCFVAGRGEVFEPLELDLSSYHIAIIKPNIHVSTKDAFAGITPQAASFDLRKLSSLPITEWKSHVRNDFESTIGKLHPIILDLKREFYDAGALYASMSGSGSAVYGIFENTPNVHSVMEKLNLTSAPSYTSKFL
ncbi:MAG: 4-(cytidine 5'-diphospho)-2-C-methyl-D-erythritol kinase [Flavobacteriales bacterium]